MVEVSMEDKDEAHVALAKARIVSDSRYLSGWQAEMVKIIVETKSLQGVSRKLRPMLIITEDT